MVRHGESEGNSAKKKHKRDRGHEVPEAFYERSSATFRLTDRGIQQAQSTGEWIREDMDLPFDRYICSEYTRAMETAGHLGIPGAQWHRDTRIQERDWGDMDVVHPNDRKTKFAESLKRMKRDSFNMAPQNGESIAALVVRLWQPLHGLHERFSDKRVIWVCHGEVMWGMRFLLERMTQPEWCALDASEHPYDRINNCQVLHYTRKDPETGELSPHLSWWRSVLPEDMSKSTNVWKKIPRRTFSNEDLLAEVALTTRMVNHEPCK
jgi:NAD+ kinase